MGERLALGLLVGLLAGCNQSTISGKGTGDTVSGFGSSASSSTVGSAGSSSAGPTAVSGGSSGTGSASSGSGSGSGSTVADTTGTGSSNGTATSSGSGGASSNSGGSSTGYAGDAGPCLPFGDVCESSSHCCSGSCDETCGQSAGQQCLSDADCSSANCQNDVCACSTSLAPYGSCGTDADCCDGISCHQEVVGWQVGRCCDAVGGICNSIWDCCDENCDDGGHCACVPEGPPHGNAECLVDSDCCAGKCLPLPGGGNVCLNGPGGWCDGGADCYTNACANGSCGSCSAVNGVCSSDQACCSGLVCAAIFTNFEENGPQHELVDAGSSCCAAAGSACGDAGDCCSQTCSKGSCACAKTTERCYGDQSCCSGGSCMLPLQSATEFGLTVCCQATGQFCISDGDCCTESCVDQQCACVATGGQCGIAGLVAPAGPGACCSGGCSDAGLCL